MAMTDTHRRVQLERCRRMFERGASIEAVLAEAWQYGFIEGDKDTELLDIAPETDDAQLDEAMREIEAEREAIESGCVEPPELGWLPLPRRAS